MTNRGKASLQTATRAKAQGQGKNWEHGLGRALVSCEAQDGIRYQRVPDVGGFIWRTTGGS